MKKLYRVTFSKLILLFALLLFTNCLMAQLSVTTSIVSSYNGVDVSCNGICDGEVIAIASGGMPPYSYLWDAGAMGQSTASATGLCANVNYSVIITDNNGSTATASISLSDPLPVVLSPYDGIVTSLGAMNGIVSMNVAGGTLPYSFLWSTGQPSTTTISILNPGTYSFTATDVNNCLASDSAVVRSSLEITGLDMICDNSGCGGSCDSTTICGVGNYYSYNWNTGANTQCITVSDIGLYSLTVSDGNGSFLTANQNITFDSLYVNSTNISCTGTGGSASVVHSNLLSYSYLWNTGETTQSISNLPVGNYSVTVTSSCQEVFNVSVIQPDPISLTPYDGFGIEYHEYVIAEVNGGQPPFTYEWSNGEVYTTNQRVGVIDSLYIGSYGVTVTDINNCTASTVAVLRSNLTMTGSNVMCVGDSICAIGNYSDYRWTTSWGTGTIGANRCLEVTQAGNYQLSAGNIGWATRFIQVGEATISSTGSNCGVANGTSTVNHTPLLSYTYLWNTGDTSKTVMNLAPGVYSVTATCSSGYEEVLTDTIAELEVLVKGVDGLLSSTGAGDGNAAVIVIRGFSPYSYQWSTGDTTQIVSGLWPGVYQVTVTDTYGCTALAESTIRGSLDIITTGACSFERDTLCPAGGGTSYLSYLWSTGDTTECITAYLSDTYGLTVTDGDLNTFSTTASISNNSPTLDVTDTPCPGSPQGEISVVNSKPGSYTYAWNSNNPFSSGIGATTQTISNLVDGRYWVTITESPGCSKFAYGKLNQINTLVVTPMDALGYDGSISVNASGGAGGYDYCWSGCNSASAYITPYIGGPYNPIAFGSHGVTVTDINGCSATQEVTLWEEVEISGDSSICSGGTTTLCVIGALPVYSWSNGATTPCITVSAGTYTVTIASPNYSQPATRTVTTDSSVIVSTDVSCFGESDGTATVSHTFSAPHTYLWNTGDTTVTVTGLSSGSYMLTVSGPECQDTLSVTISEPGQLVLSPVNGVTSSISAADGTVSINATGGTSPYSYNWDMLLTTSSVSNLMTGCYDVTATDANGCSATSTACVYPPASISGPTMICDGETATLCAASGFTSYLWSTGETTSCIIIGTLGTHTLTITDGAGLQIGSHTLNVNPPLYANTNLLNDVSCFNGSDGNAFVTITGGSGLYTSSVWSNTFIGDTLSNALAGSYDVIVSDSYGCTATSTIIINEPSLLSLQLIDGVESAPGASDGTLNAIVSNGTPPYTYFWENGQTVQNPSGLAAGCYDVTVEDANGCEISGEACVLPATTVFIVYSYDSNFSTCGQCTGEINVIGNGGVPPYSYLWSDLTTSSSRMNVCPGNYGVTITDDNGNTTSESYTISETSGCVWPGDENNDQVVNMYDFLSLGQTYGESGPARANTSIVWAGYEVSDWSTTHNSGSLNVNNKHVDSDGNGIITNDDTLAIVLNYDSIYQRYSGLNGQVPLFVEGYGPYGIGESVSLPIHLGTTVDSAENTYGLAFSISYDPTKIDAGSVDIDFSNCWLDGGNNLLTFAKDFSTIGRIDIAITRIDHQSMNGSGPIGLLNLKIRDDLQGANVSLTLEVSNSKLLDPQGIETGTDEQDLLIDINTPVSILNVLENIVNVFPNPVDEELTLTYPGINVEEVNLYSVTGYLIKSYLSPERDRQMISAKSILNGVYIIKVKAKEGTISRRVIIQH